MGFCSHSHPRSKGYDHTDERWCCSLDGLAQAHICLSSMNHHLAPVSLCPWVTFYLKREREKKKTPQNMFLCLWLSSIFESFFQPPFSLLSFQNCAPPNLFLCVSLFSFPFVLTHTFSLSPPTPIISFIVTSKQTQTPQEFCPGESLAVLGLGTVKEYRTLTLL